jgi:DNA-binding response OmpR family regulator
VTLVSRRILVVEDDFLVALTTIDILESIGCEIVGPASRLAAAVQLAQTESLDAAILDINISGEMIWPVAEELQRRDVPFLFLSAYPQPSIVPKIFATIARLEKPLAEGRLVNHLHAIWGRHQ